MTIPLDKTQAKAIIRALSYQARIDMQEINQNYDDEQKAENLYNTREVLAFIRSKFDKPITVMKGSDDSEE